MNEQPDERNRTGRGVAGIFERRLEAQVVVVAGVGGVAGADRDCVCTRAPFVDGFRDVSYFFALLDF